MEYKLVNPNRVSHINVYKERDEVFFNWGGWCKLTYLPFKKKSFFYEERKEGYYENGYCGSFNASMSMTHLQDNIKKYFVLDDSVWTYPHIDIFCGEKIIHTEYFKTFEELESHLKQYYSNVNIKY